MIRIGAPIVADPSQPRLQEVFKRYGFGPFELDAVRLVLALGGEPLALGPRVVAALLALVERAGEVVTKNELLDRVWAGEDVGESNVAQSVYTLRKVLRDHGLGEAIATVPRRGYRFTARVELLAEPARAPLAVRAAAPLPADRARAAASPQPRRRWLAAAAALALAALGGVPATPVAPAASRAPALSARGAEQYRLGRYYWNLRTHAGLAASRRLFATVVTSDPRSPLGYAALADADLMTADYQPKGPVKPAVYFARARAEIRTALALDPSSAAAHTSLGMLSFAADHAAGASETEFRRAIALDAGYALAHHWYGTTLLDRGRLADATRELQTAATLDPVSAANGGWLAEASYYRGRYADAIVYARRALDLDPQRRGALRCLGLSYELAGDLPRAIAAFERMRRSTTGEAAGAAALLAEAYARAGRRDLARAALRAAVRVHPRDGDTALAMLALGKREQGLAILAAMRPESADYPGVRDPRVEPFIAALRMRVPRRKPFG